MLAWGTCENGPCFTPYWRHQSLSYLKKIWMPVSNINWCPWTFKGFNIQLFCHLVSRFTLIITNIPQEESKCKYAQFLHWILKDDDVYFKKNHSILNLREFCRCEYIGFLHNMLPSPYGVTRPQWVNITHNRQLKQCHTIFSEITSWNHPIRSIDIGSCFT